MLKNDEWVLGVTSIDGYTHDNSAVIVKNGKILFAASEERYTRIKHDGAFPQNTINGALEYLKINPITIKTVAVGYPKRKILSVIAHRFFYEVIPFSLNILLNRNIQLISDVLGMAKFFYAKYAKKEDLSFLADKKVIYVDHHLSHAASAYYTSGFKKAISIALDAFGSDIKGTIRSGAIYLCNDNGLTEVMSVPIYSSLGLFYQSVTYILGFKPGDGEGKTMGLAAYGNGQKNYDTLRPFSPTFVQGSWIPGKDWLSGMLPTMPKLAYLFNASNFGQVLNTLLTQGKKEDVAAAAQDILEEELIKLVKYLVNKYPDYSNICLSGGLFLNVKANKKISELSGIKSVFVQPNAGDGGVALGAALMTASNKINKSMVSCGLGESFTDAQILTVVRNYGKRVIYHKVKDISDYTATQIIKGNVIGWFQGRAEWGPRALGFRSVVADPRDSRVKERINHVLKNREWFMPFAPSILEEQGSKYFKNFYRSPFMTMVFDVVSGKEKLFPAALHIDNTARPNSVNLSNNQLYYKLIQEFYKKTGLPIILNTSFNRHGLPVVNSPQDAIDHLLMGAVDELIIGSYSVISNEKAIS